MKTHKPTLTEDEVRQITARNHGVAATTTTLRKMKLSNWQELKLDGMTVFELTRTSSPNAAVSHEAGNET